MIVECTEEIIIQVLDYCRMGHLAYLNIDKTDDKLVMDYILRDHLESKETIDNVDNARKKSLHMIVQLMEELKDLQSKLEQKVEIINYNLLYDCTTENVKFKTNKLFANVPKTKTTVDFNELFEDKLDKKIPSLFTKVSAKKYVQITYKDLIDILKSDN